MTDLEMIGNAIKFAVICCGLFVAYAAGYWEGRRNEASDE